MIQGVQEDQDLMWKELNGSEEDSRKAEQDPSNPDDRTNPTRPKRSSLPSLRQRSGEGKVSIHAHECKKQHATVIIHPDDDVDQLAHGSPESPVELVGHGQVGQIDVGTVMQKQVP
uniref:Uncharacterized protein n=1 Tax=Sphaeramia orbicularis TaxID=375764 RepID=A0A673CAN4_9TELE